MNGRKKTLKELQIQGAIHTAAFPITKEKSDHETRMARRKNLDKEKEDNPRWREILIGKLSTFTSEGIGTHNRVGPAISGSSGGEEEATEISLGCFKKKKTKPKYRFYQGHIIRFSFMTENGSGCDKN